MGMAADHLLVAGEAWNELPMRRDGQKLVAFLPTQPAAGKIEYRVRIARGGAEEEHQDYPACRRA